MRWFQLSAAAGIVGLLVSACSVQTASVPVDGAATTPDTDQAATPTQEVDDVDEVQGALLGLLDRDPLCRGDGSESAVASAQSIMDNTYDLGPAPPVELPRDLDWGADPFTSSNWQFNLHALR